MTNCEWLESLTFDELGQFLCDTAFKGNGCAGCRFEDNCRYQHNGAKVWLAEEYCGEKMDKEC